MLKHTFLILELCWIDFQRHLEFSLNPGKNAFWNTILIYQQNIAIITWYIVKIFKFPFVLPYSLVVNFLKSRLLSEIEKLLWKRTLLLQSLGWERIITHSFLINRLNCASKDRRGFNNLKHLHFQIKLHLIALYLICILKSIC